MILDKDPVEGAPCAKVAVEDSVRLPRVTEHLERRNPAGLRVSQNAPTVGEPQILFLVEPAEKIESRSVGKELIEPPEFEKRVATKPGRAKMAREHPLSQRLVAKGKGDGLGRLIGPPHQKPRVDEMGLMALFDQLLEVREPLRGEEPITRVEEL